MLIPSYADLMQVLNDVSEKEDQITSRYTIVIAAAKRARQLIDGDDPMVDAKNNKPVSTAVEELYSNKIKVVPEGEGTIVIPKKILEEQYRLEEEASLSKMEKLAQEQSFKDDFSNNSDNNNKPSLKQNNNSNDEDIFSELDELDLEDFDDLSDLDDLDDLEDLDDLDELDK